MFVEDVFRRDRGFGTQAGRDGAQEIEEVDFDGDNGVARLTRKRLIEGASAWIGIQDCAGCVSCGPTSGKVMDSTVQCSQGTGSGKLIGGRVELLRRIAENVFQGGQGARVASSLAINSRNRNVAVARRSDCGLGGDAVSGGILWKEGRKGGGGEGWRGKEGRGLNRKGKLICADGIGLRCAETPCN